MIQKAAKKARLEELAVELKRVANSPTLSTEQKKAFLEKAHAEVDEINGELKALEQAHKYSWGTEANMGASQVPGADDGIVAASPMDMTQAQVQGLMAAAQARTPFSVEIQPKSFRDGIQTKAAVTESGLGGSFSGNLPRYSLYAVGLGMSPPVLVTYSGCCDARSERYVA